MTQQHLPQRSYWAAISLLGAAIVVWALITAPGADIQLLVLLMALNAVAQAAAAVSVRGKLTIGVGSAVNLAAVSLFGIQAGILVGVVANISIWIALTARKEGDWQGKIEQLPFNLGMESIYVTVSGVVLLTLQERTSIVLLPWLAAALVNDQLNMWMLYLMVRLQHGISARQFFARSKQAIPVNMTVLAVGGFLLSSATLALGWEGIFLFLFPLLLAAYSFRLYIRESDRHLALVTAQNEALASTNAELQELGYHKERILALLSHDMRTSLTAISSSAQLLLRAGEKLPPEKQTDMLRTIVRSEHILTSMVGNILKLEQTQGETPPLDLSFFDLADLVAQSAQSLRALALEKQIALRIFCGEAPVFLAADRQMLQQVVLNLVSNAIKYSDQEEMVYVTLEQQGNDALLTVEDTGLGIHPRDLPNIFEPYYRAAMHESAASGTGLGLSIVKTFVEAHEGKVTVDSEVGRGSRFVVRLPLETQARRPSEMLPSVAPTRADIVA